MCRQFDALLQQPELPRRSPCLFAACLQLEAAFLSTRFIASSPCLYCPTMILEILRGCKKLYFRARTCCHAGIADQISSIWCSYPKCAVVSYSFVSAGDSWFSMLYTIQYRLHCVLTFSPYRWLKRLKRLLYLMLANIGSAVPMR
jgi:hypothetical protein